MRTIIAGCAALALLASASSLQAHHSLANFDTTTAVRVKGTIVLVRWVNPHSIIVLDQTGTDGRVHRWAVEGPTPFTLVRRGIAKDRLKPGDVIEACGYVLKNGIESIRTVPLDPIASSLKATAPTSVSGRLLEGELLIMPDGRMQLWSDYGQHKCLGPDYQDNNVK